MKYNILINKKAIRAVFLCVFLLCTAFFAVSETEAAGSIYRNIYPKRASLWNVSSDFAQYYFEDGSLLLSKTKGGMILPAKKSLSLSAKMRRRWNDMVFKTAEVSPEEEYTEVRWQEYEDYQEAEEEAYLAYHNEPEGPDDETVEYEDEYWERSREADSYEEWKGSGKEDDVWEECPAEDECQEDFHQDTACPDDTPDTLGRRAASYAAEWVGVTPYVGYEDREYSSLEEGTDCSGFVSLIYGELGVDLPAGSDVYQEMSNTNYENLEVGDIVVYRDGGHVGIYAGDDTVIHCSNEDVGTICSDMWYSDPTGYVHVG